MIKSRIQTVILILAALTAITQGTEPNTPAVNLTFELKREAVSLSFSDPFNAPYKSIFIVKANDTPDWSIDEIMASPSGKSLSIEQKKLMFETDCVQGKLMNRESHEGMVCLLGASEEDVKKLAQAIVEAANKKAQNNKAVLLELQAKYQKETAANEETLLKIEKENENLGKNTELAFIDTNKIQLRESIIIDTTKLIDQINVEMAGLSAKIDEIGLQRGRLLYTIQHRDTNEVPNEKAAAELENMRIESLIEFKGLEAKKKTAEGILQRENGIINMCRKKEQLENDIKLITLKLQSNKRNLEEIESKINNPPPENKPLEIFDNKVTIYSAK